MDHIWSPWRYRYVAEQTSDAACIFCTIASENRDAENFLVYRARLNFIILNRYPYTTAHLMVVPYEHVATLEEAGEESLTEMTALTRTAEKHLRALYRPEGLNIGMNLGASAGAGVQGHIHMHVLPRWIADANFMTTVGETRVLPEDLPVTFEKLARAFRSG